MWVTIGHGGDDPRLAGMTGVTSVLMQTDPRDTLDALRETLARVETLYGNVAHYDARQALADMARLSRLIAEIDRQRPLGSDGTHGNLHTPTCGCPRE